MKSYNYFLTVFFLFFSSAAFCEEIKGKVEEVSGMSVKIRVQSEYVPNLGDKVQVSDNVPGIGEVAIDGSWRVSSIEWDLVSAEPEGSPSGKPLFGYSATIFSSHPQKISERAPGPSAPSKATLAQDYFYKGEQYYYGQGVPLNYEEAAQWYIKASELGHVEAQTALGSMYRDGMGVRQDNAEAVRLFRLAAEKGNADAQGNLGWIYQEGLGVPQSHEEAVKWYRMCANQGNARGQNNLGYMYQNGYGVSLNDFEAVKWFQLSAAQNDDLAQMNLGFMYESGRGVPQNRDEAVRWYQMAAQQGNEYSQKKLREWGLSW
jgi:hypothetical protein